MTPLSFIQALGTLGIWLPVISSFIFLPALYLTLSADAHKEHLDAVKWAATQRVRNGKSTRPMGMLPRMDEHLALFELDLWLVGAFGVLMASIVGCGHLVGSQSSAVKTSAGAASIETGMSIYATFVVILVAMRLYWARLVLTRTITGFYASFVALNLE